MNARRLVSLTLGTALAFGCSDQQGPNAPIIPSFAIQDAAHGGSAGFYFLPPLVKQPVYGGSFDPAVAPTVEICESPGCIAIHATFTRSSGAGSETIRMDPLNQLYIVNWHTDRTGAVAGHTYRVRVLVDGTVLGFADVWLAGVGNAPSDPATAILKGSTLPIKFRIETGSASQLPGAIGDPAVAAIPLLELVPRLADYSTGDADLPGLPLSFNTIMVVIAPNATLGELNALLRSVSAQIVGGIPGVAGKSGGILVLRLPTADHAQLKQQLALLRQQPIVLHVTRDHLDRGDQLPLEEQTFTLSWVWSLAPTLPLQFGTWGLAKSRVPQMWNLNQAVGATNPSSRTAVFDLGFFPHPQLVLDLDLSSGITNSHGTHVAGIIGATFGDGIGTDGVNPFARLVVKSIITFAQLSTSLSAMISLRSDLRVVNISIGYDWGGLTPPKDPRTDPTVRAQADTDGAVFAALLTALEAGGSRLPVILAAAGNDNVAYPGTLAAVSSAYNAAALLHNAAPILVVESNALDPAGTGTVIMAATSNLGGHLSAPGANIYSTFNNPSYFFSSGTSMAAPLVAGVVGYLYALDPNLPGPTMSSNPIGDLLLRNAIPVSGGASRVDAFATLMDLDRLRGTEGVLRALVDVDDGTVDGNTRLAIDGVTQVATDSHGDGDIDMADFRRWRDWLLDVELRPNLNLDGDPRHPKRDLNGDGAITLLGASENLFPRGDFNGDGIIDRAQIAPVMGVLGGRPVTDLEVLQERFTDPNYTKVELPVLIDSGDLTVDVRPCWLEPTVRSVVVRLLPTPGPAIQRRVVNQADSIDVFTVPVSSVGYVIDVQGRDGSGAIVRVEHSATVPVTPGSDSFFRAQCAASIVVQPSSASLAIGQTQQFVATVTGVGGQQVTWTASGGSIDINGVYTAGSAAGGFSVTATSNIDNSVVATVPVTIQAPPPPPPPPAGPGFFLSGPPVSDPPHPLHFTISAVNFPIDDVRWAVSAGLETSMLTSQPGGPVVVSPSTTMWVLDVDHPNAWQTNIPLFPGLTVHLIDVTVCAWKNGQFYRDATGNLVCRNYPTIRIW